MTSTIGHDVVLDGNFDPSTARVVMIGAGQVARMTYQASVDYGIAFHVLATAADDPAVIAGAAHTLGRYDCYSDLAAAANHGQVVTFDHDQVTAANLHTLEEADHLLRPNARALAFAQDRLYIREKLARLGHLAVPMARFAPASTMADLIAFTAEHGWPVVLKARRSGCKGPRSHFLAGPGDASRLLPDTPNAPESAWVVEEYLELAGELAILVARRPSGQLASYPPVGIHQIDGVLREFIMPAQLPDDIVSDAVCLAESVVAGLDATGVCAVKFFWTTDGRLLLNGLTLRPYSSGYATIEACATSQFHQHLRGVLDWPLGPTTLISPVATVNLIGKGQGVDLSTRLPEALGISGARVHLYTRTSRPGRNFGHVTALGISTEEALAAARAAATLLTQP